VADGCGEGVGTGLRPGVGGAGGSLAPVAEGDVLGGAALYASVGTLELPVVAPAVIGAAVPGGWVPGRGERVGMSLPHAPLTRRMTPMMTRPKACFRDGDRVRCVRESDMPDPRRKRVAAPWGRATATAPEVPRQTAAPRHVRVSWP
jgi:hypothetical protein